MNKTPGIYSDTDLLAWVGSGYYKTIESFINEAQTQGCSRRLPWRLDWLRPGKTRVFLAHEDDQQDKAYGVIFGFYTINSIHIIYDDLECGRHVDYKSCRPVLHGTTRPPKDLQEFTEYVSRRKIKIVHRQKIESDPLSELLEELWKEWLKEALKNLITDDGDRMLPYSFEADNLERLCGGASSMSSGRYPGAYACDDLQDWLLDHILDWWLDQPELPDEYFWEESIEEEIITVRRKRKKSRSGVSRSGRLSVEEIHERYGEPPKDLSGLTLFDEPYPLYYHPPRAAFRGFQRIDGNSLLLKVKLAHYIR